MANVNVPTQCPPPFTTPLLTGESVATPNKEGDVGKLTWPWIAYFNCISRALRLIGNWRATFVIPGDAEVGVDIIDTRHIITLADRSPKLAAINAKGPPTTADLIVDITHNGVSIFGATKLVLPNGSTTNTVVTQTAFASPLPVFTQYGLLKGDVVQTGGASGVEFIVEY